MGVGVEVICTSLLTFITVCSVLKTTCKATRVHEFQGDLANSEIHHIDMRPTQDSILEKLKVFSSAIVLYQRDLQAFEQYIGAGRVHFVHYGVTTDHFVPREELVEATRIVVVGVNGRNFDMLERVVRRLLEKYPTLQFDFVVPSTPTSKAKLAWTESFPQVRLLRGLSDQELLDVYQRSYLMLLPLQFSGANTSIVEALSCGLPVVSTDVGGVHDYGGGSVFEVVENDNDDAMIALTERYLKDPEFRRSTGRRCREFAVTYLDWEVVAPQYLQIYRQFIAQSRT